jgi:hypothetical protein
MRGGGVGRDGGMEDVEVGASAFLRMRSVCFMHKSSNVLSSRLTRYICRTASWSIQASSTVLTRVIELR